MKEEVSLNFKSLKLQNLGTYNYSTVKPQVTDN